MVKYLTQQARKNPRTFLSALARIIPLQVTATGSTQIIIEIVQRFDDEPVAGRVAGPRMLEAEVAPLPGCGGRDLCGGRATAGFKRTSAENSPA